MRAFTRTNVLLVLAALALAVAPVVLGAADGRDEPFAGADAQAEQRIAADHPDYRPWFTSLFEPPSGEVESGLFALQAALGGGVLGYVFGVARTRRAQARTRVGQTSPTSGEGPDSRGSDAVGPGSD